jgi:PEGA domain
VTRNRSLLIVTAALATAVALRPAAVSAQPRGGYHGGGTHVSVGVGFGFGWGYPVYGYPLYGYPYFYNPFWWGYPLWSYPAYPYPYYPYPYYSGADLRIQAQPKQAEVYVDGYLVGTVDNFDGTFQRLDMPPGEHEVTLYSPTYRPLSQRMLFRPGQSYKIKTVMQPLAAGEQEEPRPAPSARPQEQAPIESPRPGPPPPGRPQGPPMGPPPRGEIRAEQFGTLSMRVQPGDAEIAIDGERWEAPGGERIVVQLSDGTHRVDVRKEGYKPYSSTVRVHAGETTTLNVSLPGGG